MGSKRIIPVLFCLLLMRSVARAGNAVPFINNPLVPTSVAPGSGAFTLTVNGGGFVSGATVNWKGSPLVTTFVSNTKLTAAVPASDVAKAGSAEITVTNPGTSVLSYAKEFLVAVPRPSVFFANAPSSPFGYYLWQRGPFDFRGNGQVDLLADEIPPINPTYSTVLLGNGDGTFTPSPSPLPAWFTAVAVGDFNGDGKLDVIAQSGQNGPGPFQVFWGNGDGTFSAGPTVSVPSGFAVVGNGTSKLRMADLNGDGMLDLLLVTGQGTSPTVVKVLWGSGDGTFTPGPSTTLPAGFALAQEPLWDFNGDGKLDLLLESGFNTPNASFKVLLGNGDGTFAPVPGSPLSVGPAGHTATVADFNGDGKLDLAVPNGGGQLSGPPHVAVFLGNGDGTFTPVANCCGGETSWDADNIIAGDFNNDGKLDLAVTVGTMGMGGFGNIEYLEILLGNGDGTFTPTDYSLLLPSVYLPAGSGTADFNHNGKLDFEVGDFDQEGTNNDISSLLQTAPPAQLPDFTVTPSSSSVSVSPGSTATETVQVASVGGYVSAMPLTVTCADAPSNATCSVQPPATGTNDGLTPGGSVTFPLTITTAACSTSVAAPGRQPPPWPISRLPLAPWLALTAFLTGYYVRRLARGHRRSPLQFVLLLVLAFAFGGCGATQPTQPLQSPPPCVGGTPAGTYTLTVMATSGSITHSTTISLTVE